MPRVSVILPVHNGSNYLASAITSVLEQSHADFELHVLDDGSTDTSPEIVKSIKDSRVRYSRNPAKFGLFKTLNRGFSEAQTELVRIWAHDDRMLPKSLEAFVDFAQRHPSAGLIYSDFYSIDSNGKRTGKELLYQSQRTRTPALAQAPLSALLFFCFGCLPGNISSVMMRRAAWEKAGGFLEGIQQAPDYDMWVRVSGVFEVGFIRERLIELREHAQQLGRLGQKNMTTIEEELPIVLELRRRLQGIVTEQEMMSYWLRQRGRQHAHWIAKAFLTGNFAAAGKGWRHLKRYQQPYKQMLFWLASGNGRLFTPDGGQFFDGILKKNEFLQLLEKAAV